MEDDLKIFPPVNEIPCGRSFFTILRFFRWSNTIFFGKDFSMATLCHSLTIDWTARPRTRALKGVASFNLGSLMADALNVHFLGFAPGEY